MVRLIKNTKKNKTIMSKKSEILVLGTIAFDEIITPTAISGKILGGSASYISMSIFFKKTKSIISIVGNDFPEKHLKMFEAKDIDVEIPLLINNLVGDQRQYSLFSQNAARICDGGGTKRVVSTILEET